MLPYKYLNRVRRQTCRFIYTDAHRLYMSVRYNIHMIFRYKSVDM